MDMGLHIYQNRCKATVKISLDLNVLNRNLVRNRILACGKSLNLRGAENQVEMRDVRCRKVQDWDGDWACMYICEFARARERVRSHDRGAGSVSDFRGLLKGLPLLAIKTQVMEKSPGAGCILQQ